MPIDRFRLRGLALPLMLAAALATVALSACAPATRAVAPVPNAAPDTGPDADRDYYRQLQAQGRQVLVIDPMLSVVTVLVRRGGALARLGHDHVVASRDLHGFVAPAEGRADLFFRLDQMTVDETALRAEAGLDTQPSAEAIAGTRNNMLTRVLDPQRHPHVQLRVTRETADAPLTVRITLNGVSREFRVAARIEEDTGRMLASGTLSVNQSDFGITPFSVMGGAIAVQDRLELGFRLTFTPTSAQLGSDPELPG